MILLKQEVSDPTPTPPLQGRGIGWRELRKRPSVRHVRNRELRKMPPVSHVRNRELRKLEAGKENGNCEIPHPYKGRGGRRPGRGMILLKQEVSDPTPTPPLQGRGIGWRELRKRPSVRHVRNRELRKMPPVSHVRNSDIRNYTLLYIYRKDEIRENR